MRNVDKIVFKQTGNMRENSDCMEWNGEKWEAMKGYYSCLFCKQKVKNTTKEEHLVHDKSGKLTCINMIEMTEEPYSPCKHKFCELCGRKSEKDPWEQELVEGYWSCWHLKKKM